MSDDRTRDDAPSADGARDGTVGDGAAAGLSDGGAAPVSNIFAPPPDESGGTGDARPRGDAGAQGSETREVYASAAAALRARRRRAAERSAPAIPATTISATALPPTSMTPPPFTPTASAAPKGAPSGARAAPPSAPRADASAQPARSEGMTVQGAASAPQPGAAAPNTVSAGAGPSAGAMASSSISPVQRSSGATSDGAAGAPARSTSGERAPPETSAGSAASAHEAGPATAAARKPAQPFAPAQAQRDASADGAAAAAIAGGEADASAATLARIIPRKVPADQARPGGAPGAGPMARPAEDGALPLPAGAAAPAPAPSDGGGAKPPALPPQTLAGGAPPPSATSAAADRFPAGRALMLGFIGVLVLVGGLFGWGAFANIAGAIIAPGQVEVETRDQVVEHPDGGVVGEILVKDGDRVEAGDILMRFDDTLLRSEETILQEQFWELSAWRNRLQAETFGSETIVFEDFLLEAARNEPNVAELIEEQRLLYQTRIRSEAEQVQQLRERQKQTEQQIAGAEAQIDALGRQLEFINEELVGLRQLYAQGLAQLNRVLSLQREEARLSGEVGELTANIAQARGQLAEIEIQILQLQTQRQERAIDESRRLQYEASGIREQLAAVRERLSRMDVRAPVSGTIFNNAVFAERSVVGPGEALMYVVPENVEFIITTQVELMNIDAVFPGQEAALRFSAFSMRTTPELKGHVVRVSADAVQDERSGVSFYTAELALDPGEIEKLEGLTLLPGMPVEAYIRTNDRSPLNYLMKPLADYFSRSMREE